MMCNGLQCACLSGSGAGLDMWGDRTMFNHLFAVTHQNSPAQPCVSSEPRLRSSYALALMATGTSLNTPYNILFCNIIMLNAVINPRGRLKKRQLYLFIGMPNAKGMSAQPL